MLQYLEDGVGMNNEECHRFLCNAVSDIPAIKNKEYIGTQSNSLIS
jgi:hypothetical protein